MFSKSLVRWRHRLLILRHLRPLLLVCFVSYPSLAHRTKCLSLQTGQNWGSNSHIPRSIRSDSFEIQAPLEIKDIVASGTGIVFLSTTGTCCHLKHVPSKYQYRILVKGWAIVWCHEKLLCEVLVVLIHILANQDLRSCLYLPSHFGTNADFMVVRSYPAPLSAKNIQSTLLSWNQGNCLIAFRKTVTMASTVQGIASFLFQLGRIDANAITASFFSTCFSTLKESDFVNIVTIS